MKFFIILLLPFVVFASGEKLSVQEHNSIHGYNKKPTVKMKNKQNMHNLHKIDEKEIAEYTLEITGEKAEDIRLTHKGNILMYKIKTASYNLKINALDKTIIKKEKR
jgi:hypothetical protein